MNVSSAAAAGVNPTPVTWSAGSRPMGGPGASHRMDAAIGASAQLFGMSTDDLKKAMDGGQSILDVAASKGVSSSSVLDAIQKAIGQSAPAGATAPQGDMAARIAQRIAGHHKHHHGSGGQTATATTTTATTGAAGAAGAVGKAGAAVGSDPDGDGDNDSRGSRLRASL